jgi:hypothetical protein
MLPRSSLTQSLQGLLMQAINEKREIKKGMEPFISQLIWAISKWHRRQNEEPHQYHIVHLPI